MRAGKYSTAEGRCSGSGRSAEGGEELTTHTSSPTCCRRKGGGHRWRRTAGKVNREDGGR